MIEDTITLEDFESRLGKLKDDKEIAMFSYFHTDSWDDMNPTGQTGDIITQICFEWLSDIHLYKTSVKELIDDLIDGYSCCGGKGVIYGEEMEQAQKIAQELIIQAQRLMNLCRYIEPTEEEHLIHQKEST